MEKSIKRSFSVNKKIIKKYFYNEIDANVWLSEIRKQHNDKSLPGEQWKPIPGFSKYEASNLGRLRSLNYKESGCVKILKLAKNKNGYLQTMLKNDNGNYYSKKAHWFITLAWFGERDIELQVNHKNAIKTDNSIENLEYITHLENCQHATKLGLQKPLRGENNGHSKLTWDIVLFLRNEKKTKGRFWGRNEYAKKYGVTAKHLQKIVNDKTGVCWIV